MSKKISELPEYIGADTPAGDVPISIAGTTYRITPAKIKGTSGSGSTLGLIKIVDKAGDFFTNLATASAYIRTFTSATITNESYSNGTFWFTVPNSSSFGLSTLFLSKNGPTTIAYIEDTLGLIATFGGFAFYNNGGNNILGNVTFSGGGCFQSAYGHNVFGNVVTNSANNFVSNGGSITMNNFTCNTHGSFSNNTAIVRINGNYLFNGLDFFHNTGNGASGRFEFYGTIGTTTGNDYANFFPTNTAVIWAQKVMQTNNAGGIEGDLARAQTNGAKLFFGYADGGATDLSYTASPTNGTVISSTGADAIIPLADNTNAGLLSPSEKTAISEINKTQVKLTENINKGQVVYVSGANGTNILVSKASNATEATSSKVLGLLETTGVTNDIVNVVTFELLSGLNTSTATVGDAVWLGTSGNLIYGLASKPVAPAHLVYIGVVTRVSATVGEIFINIQNGFELNEIHDVLINTPLNNQVLAYDTASGLWKNSNKSVIILVNDSTPTTAITGTTTLTQIGSSILIPANTFSTNDYFSLESLAILKTGGAGTCNVRLHVNSSNNFATSTAICSTNLPSTQISGTAQRIFEINGGNLKNRIPAAVSSFTDKTGSATTGLSITFNPAVDNYLFTSVQLSVSTDSVVRTQIVITK
jgi:hypothetical protein